MWILFYIFMNLSLNKNNKTTFFLAINNITYLDKTFILKF